MVCVKHSHCSPVTHGVPVWPFRGQAKDEWDHEGQQQTRNNQQQVLETRTSDQRQTEPQGDTVSVHQLNSGMVRTSETLRAIVTNIPTPRVSQATDISMQFKRRLVVFVEIQIPTVIRHGLEPHVARVFIKRIVGHIN